MIEYSFFLPMVPPTATAQQKKTTVTKYGKHVRYDTDGLMLTREKLESGLMSVLPKPTISGPVHLTVIWLYPAGDRHHHGDWKVTKPDTDNLIKLLKDYMTQYQFWKDDAQVVWETNQKCWTEDVPGIFVSVEELEVDSGLRRKDSSYDN